MNSLTFLGTGGGRYVILTQRRYSGGLYLNLAGKEFIIDPGPGALIRALEAEKRLEKLSGVFVSHNHLDHYNDAEIMIEAMTHGMKRQRGSLITTRDTLAYISEYHRSFIDIVTPSPGDFFYLEDIKVQAIPTYEHSNAIGFKFFFRGSDKAILTYSSDTAYNEELISYYRNSKVLILNVIFPSGKPIDTHLNADHALEIIKKSKPELAVITHFGMQMLNASPDLEAKRIENLTGIRTIAAKDFMQIDLESLEISSLKRLREKKREREKQKTLFDF